MTERAHSRYGMTLAALILIQILCAVFFISDVVADYYESPRTAFRDFHLLVEAGAAIALTLGIAVETQYLLEILRRQQRTDRGLLIASGNLNKLIESYFAQWISHAELA